MGGRGVMSASAQAWAQGGISARGRAIDVTGKYQGMTLAQAEDTLRAIMGHEEAVVFDKNMNVIAAYSGGSGSVAIPNDVKSREGITITHNHPQGDVGYGATFSPADVSWFATSRATEIRAVGGGKGEYVYSLQVRGKQSSIDVKYGKSQLNLWAARVRADATPKSMGGTGKLQSRFNSEYNKLRRKGVSDTSARHSAWQIATGELERSLSDKAASLASVYYTARNKRYDVNR